MDMRVSGCAGCLLGLAVGDAVGAAAVIKADRILDIIGFRRAAHQRHAQGQRQEHTFRF